MPGLFFEIAVPVKSDGPVVDGDTFRGQLGLRRLDALEMAKAVGAPDQHRHVMIEKFAVSIGGL
ncbi:MAG: hypothetical protein ACKVP3_17080 [Hyphomicrobiaceae bacterium]